MADFQIWQKTEKTSVNANDILAINNSEESNKFRSLKMGTLIAASIAIGDYRSFDLNHPALAGIILPDGVVRADGQYISDSDSLYNNYRIRNLNSAPNSFTITWTADAGGSYFTASSADLPAFNVGDFVTGSGIPAVDGQNDRIKSIVGNVVRIYNTGVSGSIATTITGRGAFIRGGSSSGVSADDQAQAFQVGAVADNSGPRAYFGKIADRDFQAVPTGAALAGLMQYFTNIQGIANRILGVSDGISGPYRTGGETRPAYIQMVYLTRIK